ncbi:uncharacterized protein C8Q71DRAFT_909403 [Rhodofomes roseus]|uniref:DUF6534 domain-containing protein n=1 Tax=Rhodofomes roseus TaxID=34475 RepID=A0ABQ8K9T9_9APHY|nr:uncharacterized protein C8Q71DRAFT_909403 [Rhodofomes roseus]KAH9833859.1 hypothetical protein C8Q71DRAFT_909403 [Rhodofomes roseus]
MLVLAMPSTHSLDGSLGVALLGDLAAAILFGVTSVQATVYFKHSKNDHPKLKYTIILLCILDTVQLALITISVYTSAVTSVGDPDPALSLGNWSVKAHVAVAGVSDAIIRGLFCHRLWNFSQKNWVLVIFIAAGTTIALAGSIEFSIQCFSLLGDVFHISSVSWLLYASLGAGIGADATIAITLCLLLRHLSAGSDPCHKRMARTIMVYGVNSGMLTCLCEISCLVTYATLPNNLIFLAVFFVLPKLLLNALLATLNSRSTLRQVAATYKRSMQQTTAFTPTTARPSVRQSNLRSRFSDSPFHSVAFNDISPLTVNMPRLPSVTRPANLRASVKPSIIDAEGGGYRFDHPSPLRSGRFHAF